MMWSQSVGRLLHRSPAWTPVRHATLVTPPNAWPSERRVATDASRSAAPYTVEVVVFCVVGAVELELEEEVVVGGWVFEDAPLAA